MPAAEAINQRARGGRRMCRRWRRRWVSRVLSDGGTRGKRRDGGLDGRRRVDGRLTKKTSNGRRWGGRGGCDHWVEQPSGREEEGQWGIKRGMAERRRPSRENRNPFLIDNFF